MLNIKTFQVNPLQENCYVVSDDSCQCVIIDCGAMFATEQQAIANYISSQQLRPVHLLCTHGHFDHIFGNEYIYNMYGLSPAVHNNDEKLLSDFTHQCEMFGLPVQSQTEIHVGQLLSHGDTITFGNHQLQVLHTPGHTPGSVIFYCQDESTAFSGDTLFRVSVGRTDLPGGSWSQLIESLSNVVSKLPAETVVYTGHGPQTLIGEEIRMNPYLR